MRLNLFENEIISYRENGTPIPIEKLSGIADWNRDYPQQPVDLSTKAGAQFLILFALLYNYGGGGPGRKSEMRKLYPIIYREDVFGSLEYQNFKEGVRKEQIRAVVEFVNSINTSGVDGYLRGWWLNTVASCVDFDTAAIAIIKQMHGLKFDAGRKKKKKTNETVVAHGLTSKAFWVARELHVHGIWENFPEKYCYVPDVGVVGELIKNRFQSPFLHLFLLSEFLHNELSEDGQQITYDWPLMPRR